MVKICRFSYRFEKEDKIKIVDSLKLKGVSIREMAKIIGCSSAYLDAVINGKKSFNIKFLDKLMVYDCFNQIIVKDEVNGI